MAVADSPTETRTGALRQYYVTAVVDLESQLSVAMMTVPRDAVGASRERDPRRVVEDLFSDDEEQFRILGVYPATRASALPLFVTAMLVYRDDPEAAWTMSDALLAQPAGGALLGVAGHYTEFAERCVYEPLMPREQSPLNKVSLASGVIGGSVTVAVVAAHGTPLVILIAPAEIVLLGVSWAFTRRIMRKIDPTLV